MDALEKGLFSIPLPVIIGAFALLGLGLLTVLSVQVVETRREDKKKRLSTGEAVSDLLIYGSLIDDGILLNKNGSLSAAWYFYGDDAASVTNIDREAWSSRINGALKHLGSGWMVHVDAIRRPCPSYIRRGLSKFPDPVSEAMDEERRRFFESSDTMYEGGKVLTVTWFPPTVAEQKLAAMMFDDPDVEFDADPNGSPDEILAEFKRNIMNIESRLSSVFQMERLKSYRIDGEAGEVVYDDLLQWLHYCLTGLNHPLALPDSPTEIAGVIGGQEMLGSIDLRVGDKFVRVVSLNNEFPMESQPGMLNELAQMPCECRWNSRFIFLDEHEAISRLEKVRKKWRQKERGFVDALFNNTNGRVNQDAVAMRQDAEAMQTEVQSGLVSAGYFTMNIVLMDEDKDRLEKSANFVAKVAGELGFPAQIEELNNLDAFLGTLPAHGVENIRAPIVNTMNFADLMPSTTVWTGKDECPCEFYPPQSPALMYTVTSGNTPFRLNLHVGDVGHTIIFGPTGAGKSVLLSNLAAQFRRYAGMTIYAFDKGKSMYALCEAVGGQHYNIAGDEEQITTEDGYVMTKANYAFCPLQYLDDQSDLTWAAGWIADLATLGGLEVMPVHRNAIAAALKNMRSGSDRSLDDFHTLVSDMEVKEAITDYTKDGMMGYMLAADQDELHLDARGGMAVFEIEELMGMGDPKYNLPVLLYLFRRIEKSLKGQPAVIILDEAWLMLGHPVFRDKIREWFKVLRKANCAVILATQSLSDATGSGILDVIRESTATKIFLPNPHAKGEDTAEVYRQMGLNSQQIRIVSEAIPKRQYYYISEVGSRLFELALGPLQLAFTAVSDKESVATVKHLIDTCGDTWVDEWLRLRGVDAESLFQERRQAG